MSQEKVDKYKEEKKNRKARMEQEKKRKKLRKILTPIIAILVIATIGAIAYFMPKLTNQYATPADYQIINSDEMDTEEIMSIINSSISDNTSVE